jgi:hypothetical protein
LQGNRSRQETYATSTRLLRAFSKYVGPMGNETLSILRPICWRTYLALQVVRDDAPTKGTYICGRKRHGSMLAYRIWADRRFPRRRTLPEGGASTYTLLMAMSLPCTLNLLRFVGLSIPTLRFLRAQVHVMNALLGSCRFITSLSILFSRFPAVARSIVIFVGQ